MKLWIFGQVSTKDDLTSEEFHDGKITSEHSATLKIANVNVVGAGFRHKIDSKFRQSDYRSLSIDTFNTTVTGKSGATQKEKNGKTVIGLGLLLFSLELTEDFKK